MLSKGWFHLCRNIRRLHELIRYAPDADMHQQFWVVTCTRNAADWVCKCLDSVNGQNYPGEYLNHLLIDDDSSDNTQELVLSWLSENPDHNVQYVRNDKRLGGTENTVKGFRQAPPGSIVLELNGDDWLPDNGVLSFLNKVYADPDVWMTYNSYRFSDGTLADQCRPYPAGVIRDNGFRECHRWISSHLHAFRAEVFAHVREETFIDPETGMYWESADDMAIYLAMLEICGSHSRHLTRVNYVYNYHEDSHEAFEADKSRQRVLRIKRLPKHSPVDKL